MAQTGYTPILIYSSSTGGNAPAAGNLTNSTLGSELAINITDGKLFYKDNANAIQVIGWKTVPATAGGTGQTSYAVGDILYASSTTALSKLADVATGNALISGGVNTAPAWGKIGLTTHVSGTLGVGNGGTGTATTFTAGSVVFAGASGIYSQSNANFFWDNSNNALGIGTASPNTYGKLAVVNANASNSTVLAQTWLTNRSYSTSNNGLALVATTSNGTLGTHDFGAITFNEAPVSNGSTAYVNMYAGGASSAFGNANRFLRAYYGTGSSLDYVSLWAGGSEVMRAFASGGVSIGNTTDPGATNLSVTGNVVIATSGKGIDFSATPNTGTSELFADYEEGTWTPTFGGSTSQSGQTYDIQTGNYVKMGKYVYASFDVRLTALGTITGNLQIKGLPYTSISGFGVGGGSVSTWSALNTAYVNLFFGANSSATVVDVWGQTGAGTSTSGLVAQANMTNTSRINGVIMYESST